MIKGIAASKGYAIGTIYLHEEVEVKITAELAKDVTEEKEKLQKAVEKSKAQIAKIKEKTIIYIWIFFMTVRMTGF